MFGLAMVFVLLTYGGWNEAAYISAELRGRRADRARSLVSASRSLTALYLLVNFALLSAASGSPAWRRARPWART